MRRRQTPALRTLNLLWGMLVMLPVLLAGTSPVNAEPRTLYERLAYADLAVHIRTIDGSLRLAECQVVEVLKGRLTQDTIFIAFRSDNLNREKFRDYLRFDDNQESVLLLEPVRDSLGNIKAADRFRLVGRFQGKIDLPQEGAQATIDAVRRLAAIQQLSDIHQIWQAHRDLIHATNPLLVEAGFAQILKFRLGNAEMVPTILDFLNSRDDGFRRAALEVQAQIFRRSQRRDEPLGNEDHVVARLLTVAVEDQATEVRVAAVQALQAYGRPDVLAALRQLARNDPSQDVRYEATVAAYRLQRGDGGAQAPGS